RPLGAVRTLESGEPDPQTAVQWFDCGPGLSGIDTATARYPGRPAPGELGAYAGLDTLEPGEGVTVLLEYFPNQAEHLHLCNAAVDGRVKRIVFRHASFEHGHFLSARDHGRLADYDAFGAEVIWCNQVF